MNGSKTVYIQEFAKLLNGATLDIYEMACNSEKYIEEDRLLNDFPLVEDVAKIDVLSDLFFVPDVEFVKWLIEYAGDRVIIDCGAGSGYLSALITKLGGKCCAVEPFWEIERKLFWMKNKIIFNVIPMNIEQASILDFPKEKTLYVFARPCHSGFVYNAIQKMQNGAETLYIGHNGINKTIDLGNLPYTKLDHKGTSRDNEIVLSIIKK